LTVDFRDGYAARTGTTPEIPRFDAHRRFGFEAPAVCSGSGLRSFYSITLIYRLVRLFTHFHFLQFTVYPLAKRPRIRPNLPWAYSPRFRVETKRPRIDAFVSRRNQMLGHQSFPRAHTTTSESAQRHAR
jgi:hypothetical protein